MENLIEELTSLTQDSGIPKNVKNKLESALVVLQDQEIEASLRANKALSALDDLSEDPNIPSYLRTQIWNIVSQLETV